MNYICWDTVLCKHLAFVVKKQIQGHWKAYLRKDVSLGGGGYFYCLSTNVLYPYIVLFNELSTESDLFNNASSMLVVAVKGDASVSDDCSG